MTRPTRKDIILQPADLEELADLWGTVIELPGGRAGWAVTTLAGRRYMAWVAAPGQVA